MFTKTVEHTTKSLGVLIKDIAYPQNFTELPQESNHYGVEIEVENITKALPKSKGWSIKNDGSLRNKGVELVFTGPQDYETTLQLLKKAERNLSIDGLRPDFNERTSVHVHMDFSLKSYREFVLFITLFYIVEDAIFRRSAGESREGNPYCVTLAQMPAMIKSICSMVRTLQVFPSGFDRYGNLNFVSLSRFGTLEVRCHRGTRSAKELTAWINVLEELQQTVLRGYNHPSDILEHISGEGPLEYLEQVLPVTNEYVRSMNPDDGGQLSSDQLLGMLWDGIDRVQPIAYSYEEVKERVPKKNYKRGAVLKEYDDVNMEQLDDYFHVREPRYNREFALMWDRLDNLPAADREGPQQEPAPDINIEERAQIIRNRGPMRR